VAALALSAQPATAVSPQGFRVLTEVPTFPAVSGQEPGLRLRYVASRQHSPENRNHPYDVW